MVFHREKPGDRINYLRTFLIKKYVEDNTTFRARLIAIASALEPAYNKIGSCPDQAISDAISQSLFQHGQLSVYQAISYICQSEWGTVPPRIHCSAREGVTVVSTGHKVQVRHGSPQALRPVQLTCTL